MQPVQSIRLDCTSEILQWQSPSAGIEDGNPSNSTIDCSEYVHASACHEKSDYYQELDQEFSRYMEDPSYFQDNDRHTQQQPSHSRGFPNSQDYYFQGVDWRAQQPSGDCAGEFPDSKDGHLQRSDPSEAEYSDLNLLINYSPRSTHGIAGASPSQSRGQNFPAHLVDMPRASTLLPVPWPSRNNINIVMS
jgi:hypothetical protein